MLAYSFSIHARFKTRMKDLELILVEEIKRGNTKSFELLFKAYYPRLCKYAYSLVGNYELAADIVKDFFIGWWENRAEINIQHTLSGYLYRSIHNLAVNRIKKMQSKPVCIAESDLEMPLSHFNQFITEELAYPNLYLEELERNIGAVIGKLPDQCREIFILSRVEQLSHQEISTKLGISVNTIKVQIYRALIRLRIELKDYLPLLILFLLK